MSIKKTIVTLPWVQKTANYAHWIFTRRKFYKQMKKAPPVFIYQMGKVASSSTFFSIKNQYEGACLRAHIFTKNHHDYQVKALFRSFQREKHPVKIITMVREPISRNISAFFQNFKLNTGISYASNSYSAQELLTVFLRNYNHSVPLLWLDNNIKTEFGIDVYETPFPNCGHKTYRNKEIELLLFKHDIDDKIKERVIADFIGIANFKLQNTNVGDEKEYSATYKEIKTLALPNYYLDHVLNSKYATHFYSEELSKIRDKWAK